MKITKSELKKLLIEEMQSDPNLLKAIKELTGAIGELDVSIDYLSAAVTGENPFSIALQQKGFGRLAKPPEKVRDIAEILSQSAADDMDYYPSKGEGSMAIRQLNNLSQMVEELQGMVDESDDHEEWVESKITKAHDYINTVLNYLSGTDPNFNPVSERVYQAGEQRPAEIIKNDLEELITCYMQELADLGHDKARIAFGMEQLISNIAMSSGKEASCKSVPIKPSAQKPKPRKALDPRDVPDIGPKTREMRPLRRVAEGELTDAEYKKKKEIATAIKRDDPEKPDSERYAIATAAAKKSIKKKRGKK